MNRPNTHLLYLIPLFVAVACSGADSPEDLEPVDREPPVERAYCEAMKAGCERQIACGAVVFNHADTVAECVELTGCAAFTKAQLTDLGVTLDTARLDACVDAMESLDCEEVGALRFGFGPSLDVCDRLAKGSLEEGAECNGLVFDDCGAGLECTYDLSCPGTCTPAFEKCTQGSCGAGSYCSYELERCVPLGAVGAACEPNLVGDDHRKSCADGSYCAYIEDPGAWACAETIALGASCEACFDPACCETGAYCDYAGDSPVCAPRVEAEESCFFTAMCSEGLFCDFDTNACATPGGEGAACNGSSGGCLLGLECATEGDAMICRATVAQNPTRRPILAAGADCDSGSVCGLGYGCVDGEGAPLLDPLATGKCEATLGLPGSACDATIDAFACAEGVCNFATGMCPARLDVGEACEFEGLDTSCPYGLCFDGKCAAAGELVCESVFGAGR